MIVLVTADKYELPMGVYDTIREAEKLLNVKYSTIYQALHGGHVTRVMGAPARVYEVDRDNPRIEVELIEVRD